MIRILLTEQVSGRSGALASTSSRGWKLFSIVLVFTVLETRPSPERTMYGNVGECRPTSSRNRIGGSLVFSLKPHPLRHPIALAEFHLNSQAHGHPSRSYMYTFCVPEATAFNGRFLSS